MIEFDFTRITINFKSFKDIRYVTNYKTIYNIRNKFIKTHLHKIHTLY